VCISEDKAKGVLPHLRKSRKLPCSRHGDPRDVWPDLRVYVSLYALLRPYHEVRYNAENEPVYNLNLVLLQMLTQELSLPFWGALDKLSVIHRELDGKTL